VSTRLFSDSDEFEKPRRNIEDAPQELRVEFVDVAFTMAEKLEAMNREPTPFDLYQIICQTLGVAKPAVQPYGGLRLRTQQILIAAPWPRFFDVVLRLIDAFGLSYFSTYRERVNKLFAAQGIAWDVTDDKKLERVLPVPIATEVGAAIDELRAPEFKAALELFNAAKDAFDARPRRERDAAANAFDAMEATAKIKFGMPKATLGDVLNEVKKRNFMTDEVQQTLRRVEVLRHNHLGHGGTESFSLSPDEVDFVYVTCAAGARLFARLAVRIHDSR